MAANNMKELEKMIMREMQKAMRVASQHMLADMYEETGDFYTGKEPKVYERTGALGNTPKISDLAVSGNSVSFDAYLDTNYQYTTGDNPNMEQVLQLANYGTPWITKNGTPARSTVGKQGFWERSEEKIKNDLDNTMGKFFDKI